MIFLCFTITFKKFSQNKKEKDKTTFENHLLTDRVFLKKIYGTGGVLPPTGILLKTDTKYKLQSLMRQKKSQEENQSNYPKVSSINHSLDGKSPLL